MARENVEHPSIGKHATHSALRYYGWLLTVVLLSLSVTGCSARFGLFDLQNTSLTARYDYDSAFFPLQWDRLQELTNRIDRIESSQRDTQAQINNSWTKCRKQGVCLEPFQFSDISERVAGLTSVITETKGELTHALSDLQSSLDSLHQIDAILREVHFQLEKQPLPNNETLASEKEVVTDAYLDHVVSLQQNISEHEELIVDLIMVTRLTVSTQQNDFREPLIEAQKVQQRESIFVSDLDTEASEIRSAYDDLIKPPLLVVQANSKNGSFLDAVSQLQEPILEHGINNVVIVLASPDKNDGNDTSTSTLLEGLTLISQIRTYLLDLGFHDDQVSIRRLYLSSIRIPAAFVYSHPDIR